MQQVATVIIPQDDGVAPVQGPASAGNLVLAEPVITLSPARRLKITSSVDLSELLVILEGFDRNGRPLREELAGPNAGSVLSGYVYAQVTRVAVGAAFDDIQVGWGSESLTPWMRVHGEPGDNAWRARVFTPGTASYDVELTSDELESIVGDRPQDLEKVVTGQTGNYTSNNDSPTGAIRIRVNSQDADVTLRTLFGTV